MSSKRIKQYLVLLAVVGLIAVAANGSGTFASFSAQTTNSGNAFATGTLFLHNTANGTTCTSESATDNLSATGCSTLFSIASQGFFAPGGAAHADLTLTNAGSLAGSALTFFEQNQCADSAPTIATLTSGVTASGTIGSGIAVSGLLQKLVANTIISVHDGTNTDTYHVATTTAAGSSATVPVTETTYGHTFASGTPVSIYTNFTGGSSLCSNLNLSIAEDTTGNTFAGGDTISCVYPSGGTYNATTGCSPAGALSPQLSAQSLSGGIPAGGSRYFRVFLVAPSGLGNGSQNDQALFDLTWNLTY
jgi:hypothetical protein